MGKPFYDEAADNAPTAPSLDQLITKNDLSFVDFIVNGKSVRWLFAFNVWIEYNCIFSA